VPASGLPAAPRSPNHFLRQALGCVAQARLFHPFPSGQTPRRGVSRPAREDAPFRFRAQVFVLVDVNRPPHSKTRSMQGTPSSLERLSSLCQCGIHQPVGSTYTDQPSWSTRDDFEPTRGRRINADQTSPQGQRFYPTSSIPRVWRRPQEPAFASEERSAVAFSNAA
jgi:hypothetical protein